MDGLEQDAYSWIPEYLSVRFEPVIVEVADYVQAKIDGIEVHVWKPRPEDPTFSGAVSANFPRERGKEFLYVFLDMACRYEIHMAALKDGFQMVCRSEFTRVFDYGTRVDELTLSEGPRLELPNGPQSAFGFGNTAAVRQRLDQWADATVAYIHENRKLMVDMLEAARTAKNESKE